MQGNTRGRNSQGVLLRVKARVKDEREKLEESQRNTYAIILLLGAVGAVGALVTSELVGPISNFTRLIFYATIVLLASQSLLLYGRRIRVVVAREFVYVGVSVVLLSVFVYALYAQPPRSLEQQVPLLSLFVWFPFVYLFISVTYESRGILVRSFILYLLTLCVTLPHAVATVGSTNAFEGFQSFGQFYVSSASFIGILYFFSEMKGKLRETQAAANQMEVLAQTDALTNIPNRRAIEALLEEEIQRASRYNVPLSLITFDLDYFKKLNDTFGHDAGDKMLVELTRTVKSCLRGSDRFGRWGGEEFMILTTETSFSEACQLANRIRRTIESHEFEQNHLISASFGVATHSSGDSAAVLFKRADVALYRAKALGRNRVEAESLSN